MRRGSKDKGLKEPSSPDRVTIGHFRAQRLLLVLLAVWTWTPKVQEYLLEFHAIQLHLGKVALKFRSDGYFVDPKIVL